MAEVPKNRSAGIVVVRRDDDQWLFLILRCYKNWDFPKGLVEPGEDPLATAKRETSEETSIQDLDFQWGHDYCETEPYSGGKVAQYFIASTTESGVKFGINPEIGGPEHHEYRWATAEEAKELLPPRLRPVLAWVERVLTNR